MRFVVTAGPTREAIDPVRFISNRSSGKMGYAIAEAALAKKHQVTLISGPAAITPPRDADLITITTADELDHAVHRSIRRCDVFVMCAAVSDYKPAASSARKLKKQKTAFALKLIPTRDILASLPKRRRFAVIGFAAETHDLKIHAQKKLRAKNCDAIVANDVSGTETGMESDENEVTIFFRDGEIKKISRASKKKIARELVKIFEKIFEKGLTKKSW
ncbi:MAG TPA: phosphopantothenoylcysteine decarboxylase [Chthoniobacterales bacterium]|nr:phosphopantothenoylcysteine decarboxylase [Chthoniobacterales bacterium]